MPDESQQKFDAAKAKAYSEHVKALGRCGGITDDNRYVCIRELDHDGDCGPEAAKNIGCISVKLRASNVRLW